ncbi:DUF4245 domain-containing protein [Streptomyces bambusae]|uniref:DUF4245 domain-containing protein n=1 Tax=Streptomyces bambusae TaxID=1550616 RepID=UPI001CFEE052|nr:DUF4245 domain-containing protein [Streptomyces bambusae]MCB5166880.1 DUF4245 domain-containing protein [Streptomyces bambusae]
MKGKQTVRDMVRSLAVIGVLVALIYVFIPHDEKADPTRVVDYRVELITARRAAPYPVAAPVGLPKEWRATSVTYERRNANSWHLGYLNPADQYVAVEQSTDASVDTWVRKVTRDAAETQATQQAGELTWTRWEGTKYRALVRKEQGVTTVVTGTGSYAELGEMAAALEMKRG